MGPHGVRVVTMVTGGIIETILWQAEGLAEIEERIKKASILNRTTTLEDVESAACFIASDKAAALTSATVDISGGAIPDY
ncbi:SDR family oxidoreductase [Arthrobacter sp. Bz4]|uniref:SDR family oxidoreductase n=1 Tax=Arthrobacter sp. Bz4 TaxID=2171979 RepID=UPI00243460DD|nr:SDR family oxidoreductase [Arthrobacter sp. Bz4]